MVMVGICDQIRFKNRVRVVLLLGAQTDIFVKLVLELLVKACQNA